MSTRGIIGFVVNDEELLTYNHSDSYPSWLGVQTLKFLRSVDLPTMLAQAKGLVGVEAQDIPEQQAVLTLNERGIVLPEQVSAGNDWYAWLHSTQGDWQAMLDVGYIITGGSEFALDSLFCEWGYVIDCDRAVLEVYQGFQTVDHNDGRFANRSITDPYNIEKGYRPIRLVKSWSLEHLPTIDEMVALEDHE